MARDVSNISIYPMYLFIYSSTPYFYNNHHNIEIGFWVRTWVWRLSKGKIAFNSTNWYGGEVKGLERTIWSTFPRSLEKFEVLQQAHKSLQWVNFLVRCEVVSKLILCLESVAFLCSVVSRVGVELHGTWWGEGGLICITIFRNFARLSAAQVVLHMTQRASGKTAEFIRSTQDTRTKTPQK